MRKILFTAIFILLTVSTAKAGPTGLNSDPSLGGAIYTSNYRPVNGIFNHNRTVAADKRVKQASKRKRFSKKRRWK